MTQVKTDEEILKRLAEIEGWRFIRGQAYRQEDGFNSHYGRSYKESYPVNPLTNWSDLGRLIEKYKMDISWCGKRETIPKYKNTWEVKWDDEPFCFINHESLPHAICLAIIEAHNE